MINQAIDWYRLLFPIYIYFFVLIHLLQFELRSILFSGNAWYIVAFLLWFISWDKKKIE